jgi:hypothetical protein
MLKKGDAAAVTAAQIDGLAQQYQAALAVSDLHRAEAIAATLWEQHLFDQALLQAREHWKEFDQCVDRRVFAELGRERFVAELTSERREGRTPADVLGHIEDALHRATENVVLNLLAGQCQRAAAQDNEPEFQQCFWAFCAVAWHHVTRKLTHYPQHRWLESEILDEVERRLRSKLRQSEPIVHIFGLLDVVIARAVSTVVRRYQARAPTAGGPFGNGPVPGPSTPACPLELQQLWNHIEQSVTEIDQVAGGGQALNLIFRLELAGRTQSEIAQALSPPISQGEVSKRMSFLCRELVKRIFAFLGQDAHPLDRLPRGWRHRMIEALRQMKENLEGAE